VCFLGGASWNFVYRGADKSLARPTSPCILFDGENISFDDSLVIYTIELIFLQLWLQVGYMDTKSSVVVACFLPGRAEDSSAPLYNLGYS